MSQAQVSHVDLGAAHDGEAELVVTLTFENGGRTLVPLDAFAAGALLAACGASHPDEMIGARWDQVRDALAASSGRFADQAKEMSTEEN